MIAKMSRGYQITIPAPWRKELRLDKNSQINIEINRKKKQVIIEPFENKIPDFKELFKESKKYKHKLMPEDLNNLEEDLYD